MQLHSRSLLTCRQQQHTRTGLRGLSGASAVANRCRHVITCARSRRTASPSPEDEEVSTEQPETAPEAAIPLVRSNRRAPVARNRRGVVQKQLASPVQTLREKGVLGTDEDGRTFVDISCLGGGNPHWYSLGLLEGKEDAFINLLGTKLDGKGYTVSPLYYSPAVPPTAAERLTAAAEEAEATLASAEAAVAAAQFEADQYRGFAGQEGAENRLLEAKEAQAAAQKALEEMKTAAEGAAEAAAVSEQLLQQYDVVFWKLKKVMTVYSHNTDKLVDREVTFSRGTGGALLLMHCRLDSVLAEAVSTTYYFLDWRDFMPVSAIILNQHGLLPDDAEIDEAYKLPEPATDSFLLQVADWTHTKESEDLEAERRLYYGTAGGSPFGARPEKGERRDPNNPSRWSVTAGPTNAGAAALIAAGEPLPWELEQQQQEAEGFGAFGRGRGRGRDGRGRGRGEGRGRGRQQRQERFGQPAYAAQGGFSYGQQQQGFGQQGFQGRGFQSDRGGFGGRDGARGRGRGEGRGRGRQQQMDWMDEMGGSRYRDASNQQQQQPWQQRDAWQQQQQRPQQQRDFAVAAAADDTDAWPGAEDSYSEQNRQQQMDWMDELGSDRYKDTPIQQQGGGSYGSSKGWQQQKQQQQPPAQGRQQWQQQQQEQAAAGKDGGMTRMRQLDFLADMGSDRYSDDEDRSNYDRLEGLDGSNSNLGQGPDGSQLQGRSVGGGRDKGQNYNQQLGFMAEMGSDRYSDADDDVMATNAGPRRNSSSGGGASRSSSADFSGLLSEVADAMDFMDAGFDPVDSPAFGGAFGAPMQRNNAAGNASYMDEGTFGWGGEGPGGDVSMADSDEGSAAAKSVLQEWQSEGQQGFGGTGNPPAFSSGQTRVKPYGAEPSTRSREGLGASFEFEAGVGLASADSLLNQLPPLEAELQKPVAQQQQQQQQEPPVAAAAAKRKSRASTTSRRARKTEDASAVEGATAAGSRRKTNTRTAASRGTKKQQGAAAVAAEVPLDGWVGGADAGDEGFEEGWVDRMMDDGNDRVGLDDVMKS